MLRKPLKTSEPEYPDFGPIVFAGVLSRALSEGQLTGKHFVRDNM
jgi:hypothetical protein